MLSKSPKLAIWLTSVPTTIVGIACLFDQATPSPLLIACPLFGYFSYSYFLARSEGRPATFIDSTVFPSDSRFLRLFCDSVAIFLPTLFTAGLLAHSFGLFAE